MQLSTAEKNAISRAMIQYEIATGNAFGDFFQENILDVLDYLDPGALAFAIDRTNISGLTFAYQAGTFFFGGSLISVAAGTILLTASTTNYVEADAAGTVSKNTVGFTAGRLPLYTIATGAASITSITDSKPVLTLPGIGSPLAVVQERAPATINATAAAALALVAPAAGVISGMTLYVDTTITADNTNYWTFSAVNKTSSGAGSTAVLAATDPNTTKSTGGSGITNFAPRTLTLHGTGANLVVAKNDLIVITATKAAAAGDLVNLRGKLEVTPSA